jgi:ATP-dependent Lon protease
MGMKENKNDFFPMFDSDEPEEINEYISIFPADEDSSLTDTPIPENIPILPLKNTVLFPNLVVPITISRDKSIQLVNDVYNTDRKIGVVAQKSQDTENPEPKDFYQLGTIAHIIKKFKLPDGNTMVIIQGLNKFIIKEITETKPYFKATVDIIKTVKPKMDQRLKAMLDTVKELAMQIVNLSPNIPKEAGIALQNIDAPAFLVNFIASNLNIDVKEKQSILEINDLRTQIEVVMKHLNNELQILTIRNEIQSKVRTDIDKQQRDYLLHQQLKTIYDELGLHTPEKELEEFRKRAKDKKWSKAVQEVFEKEVQKLNRMNPAAADYSVVANYIELLLDLPWEEYSKDNLNLKKAKKILDEDHYGLDKIKERILEYLSVIKLKGDMKSPILCLYGPPGVGKTSLGKSLARAMGRNYIRISLGGLHDEAEIRGHRKTYIGAMPGRIIQSIKKTKFSNPVMVLDEIDKVGNDFRGDPSSALLEVLDPEQNSTFYDNYLEMEYDLSHIMFVATANTLDTIHPALRDRMEIIELSGYLLDEKVAIAKKYLIPKQMEMHGLKSNQFSLPNKSIETIIEAYTRESGVRGLEKKIAKLCRWQAKSFLSGEDFDKEIPAEKLTKILGPMIFEHETYVKDNLPGLVTGLAWTPAGGDVLYIETSLNPGKGLLNLTGKLGEVMKESAMLALTYLKAHYKDFGINPKAFDQWDIHIHVPEGSVPKEGPSAGITLLTALVSVFTQRSVKKDIAMTGELTLRGVVLPVGGIKEKLLAAKRQGVKEIILCENNRKDVMDINEKYLSGLKFYYVKNAIDVIDHALEKKQTPNALNVNDPEFAEKKK